MRGGWKDFTSKWGFGDGSSIEDQDFKARELVVKAINKLIQGGCKVASLFKKAEAYGYDRAGFIHNPCLILFRWEKGGDLTFVEEEELVAELECEDIVADAYDKLERGDQHG